MLGKFGKDYEGSVPTLIPDLVLQFWGWVGGEASDAPIFGGNRGSERKAWLRPHKEAKGAGSTVAPVVPVAAGSFLMTQKEDQYWRSLPRTGLPYSTPLPHRGSTGFL